jgi:hypothetical protein
MKRLISSRVANALIALAAAISAITLSTAVSASAATSSSVGKTRVIGSGIRAASSSTDVPFTFSVDATTPAASNGIYGTFSGSFPNDPNFRNGNSAPGNFATFSGVVACLRVNGDSATIGGVITSGYGYDSALTSDGFSQDQVDLTGDWFITTAHDQRGEQAPDTVGFVDYGSRDYFTNAGYGYTSFTSMCGDPTADLGNAQFPLVTGDLDIRH